MPKTRQPAGRPPPRRAPNTKQWQPPQQSSTPALQPQSYPTAEPPDALAPNPPDTAEAP